MGAEQQGGVRVVFDENFSPVIVQILRKLGERGVKSFKEEFALGEQDEEWIPKTVQRKLVYVTLDGAQLRSKTIGPILKASRVRAIYLPKKYSQSNRWNQALWMLRRWPKIRDEVFALSEGDIRKVSWNGKITAI